ncbi:MAG: TVP38/TMEM64 family protein [Rhodospirillales bacterium]
MTVPNSTAPRARAKPSWIKRLLPVAVIMAIFVTFFLLDGPRYVTLDTLKNHRQILLGWTADHRVLVVLAFMALYAVMVAASIPGALVMTLAGGFMFGIVESTVYVVLSATLGAVAIFLIARYAFRDYFRDKAGPAIRKMEEGFRENALSYLLVLRLVPLFPFFLVNLVPAVLGVPLRTYVLGTFFGIIPGTFVYCLVGNGLGAIIDKGGEPDINRIFEPEILSALIGLALLSLIPVVYRKSRARAGIGS